MAGGPAAPLHPSAKLVWRKVDVNGRPAVYTAAGLGLPVVFLHGLGLGYRAYGPALDRIVEMGTRVIAPALPGFGGTAALPDEELTIEAYGDWVIDFLDAIGIQEPVFLVGHSFGGGAAIACAHRHRARVRALVLVNSIGGATWKRDDEDREQDISLVERPLWDWGIHFPRDLLPLRSGTRVLPVVLKDAVPNLVRNPREMWRAAHLARRADLRPALQELRRRRLPIVVLWGTGDGVIPEASFRALCEAIGREGEIVDGSHSWLLADPDAFGEVMTNAVDVARVAWEVERSRWPAGLRWLGRRLRSRRARAGMPAVPSPPGDPSVVEEAE